eukprot:gene7872-9689_t
MRSKVCEKLVSDEHMAEIKEAFDLFKAENGKMETSQVKYAFRALGIEPQKDSDSEKQKFITYNNFFEMVSTLIPKRDAKTTLEQAFKLFDKDDSGKISFEDLKLVAVNLGEECSDDDLREMIEFADIGVYSQNQTLLLMGYEDNSDNIYEYSIQNNNLTKKYSMGKSVKYSASQQPFAYDNVRNIAAVVGGDKKLYLFYWDFEKQQHQTILLGQELDPQNSMPVGSFDQSTGNYYIVYCVGLNDTYIVVYNLYEMNLVGNYHLSGLNLYFAGIVFYNGKLFLLDTRVFGPYFKVYSVNLQNQTFKQILQLETKLSEENFIFPYSQYQDTVVFVTSTNPNRMTYTSFNLTTYSTKQKTSLSVLPPNSNFISLI